MSIFLVWALCGTSAVNAAIHSLTYRSLASSGDSTLQEFVEVGLVDGVEFSRCDSSGLELKQDWMTGVTDDDPEYLKRNNYYCKMNIKNSKKDIEVANKRFNQTGGVHIMQRRSGCEWDDETGEVKGYEDYVHDGEDFLSFNLKTLTWIAAKPQAVITKHKLDDNSGLNKRKQDYLARYCSVWLKKHLNYGKNLLLRTEPPSVSLLQKTLFSPIVCHATGFYPRAARLFWTKDGEEIQEGVEIGEILPNHDTTFQMSAELKLSDPSGDLEKYNCVFHLAGVEEDLIFKLERENILPHKPTSNNCNASAVVVPFIVAVAVFIGVLWFYKKNNNRKQSTAASSLRQLPTEAVLEPLKTLLPNAHANTHVVPWEPHPSILDSFNRGDVFRTKA